MPTSPGQRLKARAYPGQFQNPLQVLVAEVMNLHATPGQTTHDADLGGKTVAKSVFPRVERGMCALARGGSRPAWTFPLDPELGITHRQAALDDFFGDLATRVGGRDGEERAGVSRRKGALGDEFAEIVLEGEKPHGVGDGGAAFSDTIRDFFLGEGELVGESLVGLGFFNGV